MHQQNAHFVWVFVVVILASFFAL